MHPPLGTPDLHRSRRSEAKR